MVDDNSKKQKFIKKKLCEIEVQLHDKSNDGNRCLLGMFRASNFILFLCGLFSFTLNILQIITIKFVSVNYFSVLTFVIGITLFLVSTLSLFCKFATFRLKLSLRIFFVMFVLLACTVLITLLFNDIFTELSYTRCCI